MYNDVLLPGSWYGEVSQLSIKELREQLLAVTDERSAILAIAELLKKGDFSVKNVLIELMNTTKDDAVLNLCIRLFCSICNHEDLKNGDNLKFLSDVSEFGAFTFASSAIDTMSYEVIPYLLALWEDWQDTNIEEPIRDALDSFLDYYDDLTEEAGLEEVGNYYLLKREQVDEKIYYYKTEPVFPGLLTKEIFEWLYSHMQENVTFSLYLQPLLLSVMTGEAFPLDRSTAINEPALSKAKSYVDKLISKNWEEGTKYFYSYPVN